MRLSFCLIFLLLPLAAGACSSASPETDAGGDDVAPNPDVAIDTAAGDASVDASADVPFAAMTTGSVGDVSLPGPTGGVFFAETVGAQFNGFLSVQLGSMTGDATCTAAAIENMGFEQPPGTTQLELVVYTAGAVTTQPYAIPGPGGVLGTLTSGYGAAVYLTRFDASCNLAPSTGAKATSGTINVVQLDTRTVAGDFTASFPGGEMVAGTFQGVPRCDVYIGSLLASDCGTATDPNFCCWVGVK